MLKLRNKDKEKGFSLVETLVALSIFSVSVLTLMIMLSHGITNTNFAQRKMTAAYLAQEGIEYIRNMRDTYALYSVNAQTGWNSFVAKLLSAPASCGGASGCYFNTDNIFSLTPPMPITKMTFTSCTNSSCTNGAMRFNSSNGSYGYTGTAAGFTRQIKVTQIGANELKIYSTVYWTQPSGTYDLTLAENLYNWIE